VGYFAVLAYTGTSGGAMGGEGSGAPPDSRFVTYGAPVHQVVNTYA